MEKHCCRLLGRKEPERPVTKSVCISPADERGDDDAPGGAAAVGAGLLRVRMGVRGVVALAPPAAKPEGVEEEEEEVQGQTQQCHGTEQQNGLLETPKKKKKSTVSNILQVRFLHKFSWNVSE